jgi:membrane protein
VDPIARLRGYLEWLIDHPVAELSRAQRFLRFAVDLTRHCGRTLHEDQAGQMAAALTYRTIFSIVPLLMVSMLVFRMVGNMDVAHHRLQQAAYALFDYQVQDNAPEAQAFKLELDRHISEAARSVESLSFGAIGGVGLLLLVWAALGLFISFEQNANRIYRAPQGRSLWSRIVIYWSLATLGPLVLVSALYLVDRAFGLLRVVPFVDLLGRSFSRLDSVVGTALLLLPAYKLIPNTAVRWRPAAIGAGVAAVLGEALRWGFGLYVSKALPFLKLYGAIGLIPLSLLWLYLTWLIVLFGLAIAFTLQTMRGRALDEVNEGRDIAGSDPQWLVALLASIAAGFARGVPVSRQDLAEELGIRLESVAELVEHLEGAGLVLQVHRMGSEDVGLTLARPPQQIQLAAVLELGARLSLGREARSGPTWTFLARCREAQAAAADGRTLAALVPSPNDAPAVTHSEGRAAPA